MKKSEKAFQHLIGEISWDNWKDDNGKYFDLCEVLNNKLEWIKENLIPQLEDEHLDTINQTQELLSLLSERKIKKIL